MHMPAQIQLKTVKMVEIGPESDVQPVVEVAVPQVPNPALHCHEQGLEALHRKHVEARAARPLLVGGGGGGGGGSWVAAPAAAPDAVPAKQPDQA